MKLLTKAFAIAFCICLCMVLSACKAEQRDYVSDYDDEYYNGYEDGYSEAMQEAPGRIDSRVEFDIWDLCDEIEDEYGIHPEDAANILSIYADVPDEVTEEELYTAIWAIYRYYHGSSKIMNGIEDYDIDY